MILLKVIELKNESFVTIDFLIMNSNFKILYAMVTMILCLNISDIGIITFKNVDYYRYIIHDINKSEATNSLTNSVLEDRGYI